VAQPAGVEKTVKYRVDLDEIRDVCIRGVRRAYLFMGLGVNAADREDLVDYHIAGFRKLQLVEDLTKEQIVDAKKNFRQWIIGNGLTELLHHYSTFLDRIYVLGLVVEITTGKADQQKNAGREKQFLSKTSISGKSATLQKEMNIVGLLAPYIFAWNKLRNCLVHTGGLVDPPSCTDADELVVKWRAMEMFVQDEDGERPLEPNMVVEKGGTLVGRVVEKERRFKLGAVIDLQPIEIQEICLFVFQDCQEVMKSVIEFMKAHGIPVRDKAATPQA